MTDSNHKSRGPETGSDDIGKLIRLAGSRDEVSPETMERARDRVAEHWEQVVRERRAGRRSRRQYWLAAAASLAIVAVTVTLLSQRPGEPFSTDIANVERVVGPVRSGPSDAIAGGAIQPGTLVETSGTGRIALRMQDGKSIRLDTDSRMVFDSSDRLLLQAGAVYIDTNDARGSGPISIVTPLGTASDIGTQFQVRLLGSALSVGVRDGIVEVEQSTDETVSVEAGRVLELDSAGQRTERPQPAEDSSWDWVESIAPAFDIDQATLEDYLVWYANEKGAELHWEDVQSRSRARDVILAGSIADTSLDEGLEIVRQIASFDMRGESGTLWIRVE